MLGRHFDCFVTFPVSILFSKTFMALVCSCWFFGQHLWQTNKPNQKSKNVQNLVLGFNMRTAEHVKWLISSVEVTYLCWMSILSDATSRQATLSILTSVNQEVESLGRFVCVKWLGVLGGHWKIGKLGRSSPYTKWQTRNNALTTGVPP